MFCDNCGKKNIKIAKYCKYCGNKLRGKKVYVQNETLLNTLKEKENQIFERKIERISFEHIITRLVISSIDFFFAGIILFIFSLIIIIVSNSLIETIENDSSFLTVPFIIALIFASFVWIFYISITSLIYGGETLGEKLVNIRIETNKKFLSSFFGPLIFFDYLFKTTFYVRPMEGRTLAYIFCLILLTWWEYIIFGLFLLSPFISH